MPAIFRHPSSLTGVVVSAGRMMKAVKVRTTKQTYNSYVKTLGTIHPVHLVSDPASSLRTGDIIRFIRLPQRHSRHIRHVVTEILAPFGEPIEARPKVLSAEERAEIKAEKRAGKMVRRTERGLREGEMLAEAEKQRLFEEERTKAKETALRREKNLHLTCN
jgi:small subunit ribosomal protein S17